MSEAYFGHDFLVVPTGEVVKQGLLEHEQLEFFDPDCTFDITHEAKADEMWEYFVCRQYRQPPDATFAFRVDSKWQQFCGQWSKLHGAISELTHPNCMHECAAYDLLPIVQEYSRPMMDP